MLSGHVHRPGGAGRPAVPPGFWWGVTAASDPMIQSPQGASPVDPALRADGLTPYDEAAAMAALGLTAHRFALSWERVCPGGGGPASRAGLDYYDRMVDALLGAGVAPLVVLQQGDLPAALVERGGWRNRNTAARLAGYAATVGQVLGDRVAMWSTVARPWDATARAAGLYRSARAGHVGYAGLPVRAASDVSADAARSVVDDALVNDAAAADAAVAALIGAHHLLVGHGLALQALRATVAPGTPIGLSLDPAVVRPAGDTDADRAFAHDVDAVRNRLFLDPLLRGDYPADLIEDTAHLTDWGFVTGGDLSVIATPIDILGIDQARPVGDIMALAELLSRVRREYGDVGLVVSERTDPVDPGPALAALAWARAAGVDLRGYLTCGDEGDEYEGDEVLGARRTLARCASPWSTLLGRHSGTADRCAHDRPWSRRRHRRRR